MLGKLLINDDIQVSFRDGKPVEVEWSIKCCHSPDACSDEALMAPVKKALSACGWEVTNGKVRFFPAPISDTICAQLFVEE